MKLDRFIMEAPTQQQVQSRRDANNRYYHKNKAKISQSRSKRYHEIEKKAAPRKEFMKLLADFM